MKTGHANIMDQQSLIRQGNEYFSDGQYESAARSYKKALHMGRSAAAAYNLAITYHHRLNYFNKAMYYYQQFLDMEPQAKEAAKVKAWLNDVRFKVFPEELSKKPHMKRPSALDLILKATVDDPDTKEANEALKQADYSRVVSLYQRALVRNNSKVACYNLALVYDFDLGYTNKAVFYYQKFLSMSSDKALINKVSQLLAEAGEVLQHQKGMFYKGSAFQLRQP